MDDTEGDRSADLSAAAAARVRVGDAIVRASFDSAPDAVVVMDRHGDVLIGNPAFQRLWDFPPGLLDSGDGEALRRHIARRVSDPAAYLRSVAPLRAAQHSQTFDTVQLGDGRVFERHVSPLGTVAGLPEAQGGVVVRWRDITERQRIVQRKSELATLLDLALASAELAYWDVDLQLGKVNSTNERWYTMLGYGAGELADDFRAWDALVHPEDAQARLDAWEAHLAGRSARYEAEFRMRHKAGHWVWLQARGQAVARDESGRATRLVGTRQDISSRKHMEHWLQSLAHTDELTGIHNRRRFLELAAGEIARGRRHGHGVALLMIDLDHFKAVNDQHGHGGGDEVLRHFVQIARTVMRQSDVFARVGGEEFAALLPYANAEGARIIAERLVQQTRETPARLEKGALVHCSVSVGVAIAAAVEPDVDAGAVPFTVQALMAAADQALYVAKAQGRNRVVFAEG